MVRRRGRADGQQGAGRVWKRGFLRWGIFFLWLVGMWGVSQACTPTPPPQEVTSEAQESGVEGGIEVVPEREEARQEAEPQVEAEPTVEREREAEEVTEEIAEPMPEVASCPSGYREIALAGSYDIGFRLRVKRCVKDPDPSACTAIHAGDPTGVRFVTVGCGFDPATERDRYNALVERITEGFLKTEPYKSLSGRWSIIRNDDLETGWRHTKKRSYCYEAWIQASGEGATAVPKWDATEGLWYSPVLLQAGERCAPHYVVVIANHSGWAGGSHGNWTGWMSVVGSGNDDASIRRLRKPDETVCEAWSVAYPGRCFWKAGARQCLCEEDIPEERADLPPNPRLYPDCRKENPQGCPWPFTHPDVFMEYTAIHEVGHTFLGFTHPSPGSQSVPIQADEVPNNCYLPPPLAQIDPKQPCPGWEGEAFTRWILPQDAQGSEPKHYGCYRGCSDNQALYAPWQGAQMMIRDDGLQYGFSPVERKIIADRLLSECWLIDQIHPLDPTKICRPGASFDKRYGTGLVYQPR